MNDTKKDGRRPMISFRADDEVLVVLKQLEAAVGSDVVARRKRSVAIRRAILEAGERLRPLKR